MPKPLLINIRHQQEVEELLAKDKHMSKNISLLKGKVVVEGKFSEPEQELLITKYKSKKVFEFWRVQLKSLTFLKEFPNIESLSLINVKAEDLNTLAQIGTLKKLFLNELKPASGWNFLAHLIQIEDLHILNTRGEFILPDLHKLDHLKTFRIFGCKGLADISMLKNAQNLEEVELVDTALTPENLLPIFENPSVKYLSSSFNTKKDNELFQMYLAKYGKKAFRDVT
jgi:hypothetical protein